MDLVCFVISGQCVHDQIDTEAERQFPLAPPARHDRRQGSTGIVFGPGRRIIIAADDNGGNPVIAAARIVIFRSRRAGFDPDPATGPAAGKCLE